MYARQLMDILHQALAMQDELDSAFLRFESLRGYGLLPRGRENAGLRLSDVQIAAAIMGFVSIQPSWAGHFSLILGSLCAVGGTRASFRGAKTLLETISIVMDSEDACKSVVRLEFSIFLGDDHSEYGAKGIFEECGKRKIVSYVSHMATSLLHEDAEEKYDHDRMHSAFARHFSLSRKFFEELRKQVVLSRHLDLPLVTDWREFECEEQRKAFHRKLGARPGSCFLNLSVDTQVTWPNEPTCVEFGSREFVLFPKGKETSHSISIDLVHQRISAEDARTLLNRFLSILSWCDDRHAVLKGGWSGNPVPVPVPRIESAFSTTSQWLFSRSLPHDEELLQRLAYYREGLNARNSGLVTFEVLSFFKVFEKRKSSVAGQPNLTKKWISDVYSDVELSLSPEIINRFNADRQQISVERYIWENCRVATAHASEAAPSDADASPEIRRLHSAAEIIHALARHFIRSEYGLSRSYFSEKELF